MLKKILITGAFVLAPLSAAHAGAFTFTSTSTVSNVVTSQIPDGPMLSAVTLSGQTQTRFADGTTARATFTCQSMATPGGENDLRGLCDVTEGANTYSVAYQCADSNAAAQEAFCWGLLIGETGRYAGKTGSVTWIGNPGSSAGQGAWKD
jgi:hypothetical protein